MREVSCANVALVADSLSQRGLDPERVFASLPVTSAVLRDRSQRLDWEVWCALMRRVEDAVGGPATLEGLFVPGAGGRTQHPFVRVAPALLSLTSLYVLMARYGLQRTMMMDATVDRRSVSELVFTVRVDPAREGSLPTFRYIAGILRSLPRLQGLDEARVAIDPESTPHHGVLRVTLPAEQGFWRRLFRFGALVRGTGAAVEELEAQAREIAERNRVIERHVAELTRATAELRRRDEWLGLALRAGQAGTWAWCRETGALEVSAGVPEMLGAAGLGTLTDWLAATHPDDRDRVAGAFAALAGGEVDVEHRVVRGGEVGWVRALGRSSGEGPGARVLGTVVDLTRQRRLDAQLRLADRLISAGTLAAGVAHEVNNPLTWILGNLQLVRDEIGADPALRARFDGSLGEIEDGVLRIRDVVADLRTFSRPDDEAVAPIDVNAVCAAAARLTGAELRHRGVLRCAWAPGPLVATVNASRLGQVVVNLLINAGHAVGERWSGRPGGEIELRTLARDGAVAIEVADNGPGIPPAVLGRVFEPFFTTKPSAVGTGLGLSIAQGIVTAFGGRLEVDTAVGVGTTFRVVVPAARAAATPPPVARVVPTRGSGRVLVVDDEPAVRRAVVELLRSRGFEPDAAEDGVDALARLAVGRYRAIVCDVMMPRMSGAGLHAALAATAPDLARRMVFVTGGPMDGPERALVDRPGVVVLPKPVDLDALVTAIAAVSGDDAADDGADPAR